MTKKCHQCKRKNARGWTCSMAPDGVEFCSKVCVERYAKKKVALQEKADSY